MSLLSKIAALSSSVQSTVALGVTLGALVVALSALSKVPAKIEVHTKQTDSLIARVDDTNKKLDVLVCIAAKLNTPLNCALQK